jgi:hypothetical protein
MPRSPKGSEETETLTEATAQVVPEAPPSTYERLCAEFDETFQRQIPGGRTLTYITGEQVVSRLNEVEGYRNWDWDVTDSGINEKEDEVWVRGTLTIKYFDDLTQSYEFTRKNGFGGAKIKRLKDGRTISLGNDMKAAETDAFKKAAAKCGVGLYLYQRTGEGEAELPTYQSSYSQAPNVNNLPRTQFPTAPTGNSTTGIVEAVSMPGIKPNGRESKGGVKVNGNWFNVGNRPIELNPTLRGQTVTIGHAPGSTFIDQLSVGEAAQEVGMEEPAMAF